MDTFILSYMLKYADSYDYIEEFCFKNKGLCSRNKTTICKKILKISGYKKSEKSDYCLIYKELSEYARELPKVNNHSYIKMTPELLQLCEYSASVKLREFLIDNGYNIDFNITNNSVDDSTSSISIATRDIASDLNNKSTLISNN